MALDPSFALPGVYTCPDTAGNVVERPCCPALLIAPYAAGSATALTIYDDMTRSTAAELFGAGSVAYQMADAYFDQNPFGQLSMAGYVVSGAPLQVEIQAPNAVGSVETATATGTAAFNIGGTVYAIDYIAGDTPDIILDELYTAVSNDDGQLFTVSKFTSLPENVTSALRFESKASGEYNNDLPFGQVGASQGLTYNKVVTQSATGSAPAADLAALVSDCCCFSHVGMIQRDTETLNRFAAAFDRRWGCECAGRGRYYFTFRGTFTETLAQAVSFRDDATVLQPAPYANMIHMCPEDQGGEHRRIASFIGATHAATCDNPSASWVGLRLNGEDNMFIDGCDDACLTLAERNILAQNGVTLTRNGPDGFQVIENDSGLGSLNGDDEIDLWRRYPQAAYQTMEFERLFNDWVQKFLGVPVLREGEQTRNGVPAITEQIFISEFKAFLRELEGTLVQNVDAAAELVQFDVNPTNPSRVDACVFFDPISALRIFSATIKPRLLLDQLV